MKNRTEENAFISEKVMKGLELTFEKLLKTKVQNNGVFVFSENGVIIKVRASEFQASGKLTSVDAATRVV